MSHGTENRINNASIAKKRDKTKSECPCDSFGANRVVCGERLIREASHPEQMIKWMIWGTRALISWRYAVNRP